MKLESLGPEDSPVIGRYRVLGILGSGGMGRVLLGVGPDGRPVAIKQVHADLLADSEFRARFRREVYASSRVSGAYTAAVIDADTEGEVPWLASLFVPGVPLDRVLQPDGPAAGSLLTTESVLSLAAGLASALTAIHGCGLIHRDLKPANVILAADGPRIVDFGIARATGAQAELTQTGSVLGSPAYMSPEQALARPLTPAGDVFALGTVLVAAATGRSPFAAATIPLTLHNIVYADPDLSALPTDLRTLIAPCLDKDPGRRPRPDQILDHLSPRLISAPPWPPGIHRLIDEQRRDLHALLADPNATFVRASAPGELPDPPRRGRPALPHWRSRARRTIWAAGAAAVFAVAAAAVISVIPFGNGSTTAGEKNPLSDLTLADLRTIDVCALLNEVSTMPPFDASTVTQNTWGYCEAEGGTVRVGLRIGGVKAFHDSGRTIEGTPVLDIVAPLRDTCSMALQPAAMNPPIGVIVEVEGADSCRRVEQLLPGVAASLRDTPPQIADAQNTLAVLDMCSVVDPAVVHRAIRSPTSRSTSGPHECSWDGETELTVRTDVGRRADGPQHHPVDLGGGVTAYGEPGLDTGNTCRRRYERQVFGDGTAELVEVQVVRRFGDPAKTPPCTIAESVLRSVVGDLPTRR